MADVVVKSMGGVMTSGKAISEDRIRAIVKMYEAGYTIKEIANRYGFCHTSIYKAIKREKRINRFRRAGVRIN